MTNEKRRAVSINIFVATIPFDETETVLFKKLNCDSMLLASFECSINHGRMLELAMVAMDGHLHENEVVDLGTAARPHPWRWTGDVSLHKLLVTTVVTVAVFETRAAFLAVLVADAVADPGGGAVFSSFVCAWSLCRFCTTVVTVAVFETRAFHFLAALVADAVGMPRFGANHHTVHVTTAAGAGAVGAVGAVLDDGGDAERA